MLPQYPEDPELRAELTAIYRRMAWVEGLHGDKAKAVVLTEQARTIARELAKAHPERRAYVAELADVNSDLGTLHAFQNQRELAQRAFQAAIYQRQRLVADNPSNNEEAQELVVDWFALQQLQKAQGDFAGAVAAGTKAKEILRRSLNARPNSPREHAYFGIFLLGQGNSLARSGDDKEADEVYRDAMSHLDEACRLGNAVLLRTAYAWPLQGEVVAAPFSSGNQPIRTLRAYAIRVAPMEHPAHQARAFYAHLAKEHPHEPVYKQCQARCCFYLVLQTLGTKKASADQALAWVREASALYDELQSAKPAHAEYALQEAEILCQGGYLIFHMGRYDECASWTTKALALLDGPTFDVAQQATARVIQCTSCILRASIRSGQHRYLEALADLSRVFEIEPTSRELQLGEAFAVVVAAARQRIHTLLRNGRLEEALADANTLIAMPKMPGQALYDAACVFALVSAKEPDDATREKQAARCVELLRQAHAAGFAKGTIPSGDPVRHMQEDPDLVSVRGRADYQRLLADLTRKQ
jgi:tetratricopeptide (TPR) repeat protein